MADPIQQMPQQSPIADGKSNVTVKWAWWFRQILIRLLDVEANFGQGRQL